MERLLAFGRSRLDLVLKHADLIRNAGFGGANRSYAAYSFAATHVRYLLGELGVRGDIALLAVALMAPLELPILDQQVRIERTSTVERVYAGWATWPAACQRRDRSTWCRRSPKVEPVDQRAPRRLDHVVADADGDPRRLAVAGLDQHPGDRVGAVALVEDAHLVVDELELRDLGERLADRGAQRLVERVDRAVALAGDDVAHALGLELHRRLGDGLRRRRLGLGDHPPRLDLEVRRAGRPSTISASSSSNDASAASKV